MWVLVIGTNISNGVLVDVGADVRVAVGNGDAVAAGLANTVGVGVGSGVLDATTIVVATVAVASGV